MRALGIRTFFFALAIALLAPTGASAQGFNAQARQATEVPGALTEWATPILREDDPRPAIRRHRGETFLASLPGELAVRIGPYETLHEGFRVEVPGLLQGTQSAGFVSTRPMVQGAMEPHVLAQAFVPIDPHGAQLWLARNAVDRLIVRVLFGLDRPFRDRASGARGVVLDVKAVQVFNESSGEVLLDTTREVEAPPPPAELTERVRLWDATQLRETVWTSPGGRRVLFSVNVHAVNGHPDRQAPGITITLGAAYREIYRFEAPSGESNIALAPRGAEEVMLIITEYPPHDGQPGRGRVVLLSWNARRELFAPIADWEGANTDTPPAWVTDPSVAPAPAAPTAAAPAP